MKTLFITTLAICLTGLLVNPVEAQKVVIKGSNTFGEELAPALIKAFSSKNPNITIELESSSSGAGIEALLESESDIASSSRLLSEDEVRRAQSRGLLLDTHIVGYYGVAVVVNPGNPIKALTDRQIEQIFSGEITNWKEIGGNDAAITVYIRDQSAGTHLGFRELAMRNKPYADSAFPKLSYNEIAETIAGDANGVGYININSLHASGIRGIIVNGIHPSNIAVVEGLYPFARQVRLITNRDNYSRETRAFIRFVQSRDGQRVVESVGFVPRFASRMDMGGF
ncbi:MAG TPA: phosphate ABC transporter substrate-binding protein [Kiritimatiellia bacterium]|nr:phosphate ABC transporter substrate-binding protein [Kiritimatiellia bacterium]